MSKVTAMQAIREARYAARASNTTAIPATGRAPVTHRPDSAAIESIPDAVPEVGPKVPAAQDTPLSPAEPVEPDALCGHRSMNNRLCRRPAGHAEKNHRYN